MATTKGLGPVKRFGVRYGRTVKHKRAKIEREQNKKHKCPYCSKTGGIKKIAVGIWHCKKCNKKFTAKAYTVGKKTTLIEKAIELSAEFPEEKIKKIEEI
ncbi:50S ribosomal protein L37ae [Candidatus Woesearchaeota archaeon]|nr:MAG: 50S ribosomal protein L37ae [Candidatus Woesearchaeota archaeon ex4484_78]RLE46661.1 MAG: 50S ribosomal protein L37ae [Candidatus Woesearchaeota archaeon]